MRRVQDTFDHGFMFDEYCTGFGKRVVPRAWSLPVLYLCWLKISWGIINGSIIGSCALLVSYHL